MALSIHDREQFLAQPHIAALSVAAGADRGPLSVPIWYQYTTGAEPWILAERTSRKVRLIEAAGHFTLMVEQVTLRIRYVSVSGRVARSVPGTDEMTLEMAERYLPPDRAQAYLEYAAGFDEQIAIYLRPEYWLSADLGPG
jgi:nitroimidazol reductase NimA-like FMN-containing flavoprotein (pyridoxamine 5'-phosphate oxidase superfamily)